MKTNHTPRILVVDDQKSIFDTFTLYLQETDTQIDFALNPNEAIEIFKKAPFSYAIAFVDHHFRGLAEYGDKLASKLKKINKDLVVVMISSDHSDSAYASWLKADVDKVVYKPFSCEHILLHIKTAFDRLKIQSDEKNPQKNYAKKIGMIGSSPSFQNTAKLALKYAQSSSEALIMGETGTGKELIAKAIHRHSDRVRKKFLPVNCSSYKENSQLLESELFGHERGAFTGAEKTKLGIFEVAQGGSIFLDEIHHLSLQAQAKLLRVIQEKKIRRLGGVEEFSVDFRLICSAKPGLKEKCKGSNPEFLPDLFFRISTLDLLIASLKDRPEDITPLIIYFKEKTEEELKKKKEFSSSSINALKNYPWPGNIRELEMLIKKLYVIIEERTILKSHLPEEIINFCSSHALVKDMNFSVLEKNQNNEKKKLILKALMQASHNITKASHILNLNRNALNAKMKSLGIFYISKENRESLLKKLNNKLFNIEKKEVEI